MSNLPSFTIGFMAWWRRSCYWLGCPDDSRLRFDPDDVEHVAVIIRRNLPECNTHAGIAYRTRDGTLRLMHFASHKWLTDSCDTIPYAYATPNLKEEDAEYLAGFCALIWQLNSQSQIPYSFRYDPDIFFEKGTGKWVTSDNGTGFSCSTFVVVVFRSSGNPLISPDTWPSTASAEDIEARNGILRNFRASRRLADRKRALELEAEIDTARIRPEHVAGACLQRRTPVKHGRCHANAVRILRLLDSAFGRPVA